MSKPGHRLEADSEFTGPLAPVASRLERIADGARGALDSINRSRESALGLSRELVRTSANSIRAAHRGDLSGAQDLLGHADELAAQLRAYRESHGELFFAGYVQDSLKEFAEARCFVALVSGKTLPDPEELNIPWPAFLNGLGEAVGEMRRHCLDLLRRRKTSLAERILEVMDSIYGILVTMDYPDALTGGLRRTTDMVRGILERTRADLTAAVLQERLSRDMANLREQLGTTGSAVDAQLPVKEESS